jgi:hypothetical protein
MKRIVRSELLFYDRMYRKDITGGKMFTLNWPNFNHKLPEPARQPVYHPHVSPETAQVIQALQRGQRSRVTPMPGPRIKRAPQ